jgi:hypothetical protein
MQWQIIGCNFDFTCFVICLLIHKSSSNVALLNLETVVGRGEVYGFLGTGQGATTRNGYSISRSCNAAMHPKNRVIYLVADSPNG